MPAHADGGQSDRRWRWERGGAGASHCMLGWQWLAGKGGDGSPCWGIIPGMNGGGILGMPGIIMPFAIIMPGLGGMPYGPG